MTTLNDRPHSALLVVDVQDQVVADAVRRDEVVAAIGRLVDRARAQNVAVVWVQHSDAELVHGSAGWRIVDELVPADTEPIIEKEHGDSFEATDLEDVLHRLRVGRLVVAGACSDQCVRSTIHGAFVRGYDVTLVGDAHTTVDLTQWGAPPPEMVVAHTNLYWSHQSAPGRTAVVADADDVALA
ncbi:MAG: isochorismatase family protein [Mycolicibacterium neoaurum]|uniref:isochorismatase family protein n=1 Tax=Mycolicibacterium neoaurum TaxID=1795 RepID=UPI002FF98233